MRRSSPLVVWWSHRSHRRRVLRWTGAAVFVLHLFALWAVPAADAALERESREAASHIEAEGSERCPIAHDHLVCLLCRSITEVGAPISHAAILDVDGAIVEVAIILVSSPFQRSRYLPLGSRAPPLS